jgi:ABC-type dipeptide/oligopeptide/nickel transport system permease component
MTIRFLAVRLLHAVFVVLGATLIIFFLIRLTGDPAALLAPPSSTQADIDLLRHQLGLDRPVAVQYLDYLHGLLHFDLGESIRFRRPATDLIFERLPATAELAFASIVLALLMSVPLGIVAATRQGSVVDAFARVFALLGQSVPVYWSGIVFILLFSVILRWLPVSGRAGWTSIILPAVTIALYMTASLTRLIRSSMLEVIGQQYIKTAIAKGITRRAVVLRHALRNALLPVSTMVGLQIGTLLSGAVITETVFAWPGIGQLSTQAVFARDFPLVQAIVLVTALFLVLINLLVDIAYLYIDPRIRYG